MLLQPLVYVSVCGVSHLSSLLLVLWSSYWAGRQHTGLGADYLLADGWAGEETPPLLLRQLEIALCSIVFKTTF